MPIDASIYNKVNTQQVNPLDTISKFQDLATSQQGLANAQQQNQLLQTQNKAANVGLSKSKADLAFEQYGMLNKIIGDLSQKATSEKGITQNEMIGTATDAYMRGIIPKEQLNSFIGSLGEDTPQNNAATISGLQYKIQDAQKQHEITYGKPVNFDTGGNKVYGVQQDPQYGGGVNVGSQFRNELTPTEKVSRFNAIDTDTKAPTTLSNAQVNDKFGNPLPSAQKNTPPQVNQPPEQPATVGARPTQWNDQSDKGEQPTNNIGVNVNQPKGIPSALPPGDNKSMEAAAERSTDLERTAENTNSRKGLLGNLETLIKSGDFNSGLGASKWKDISSALQRPFGIKSQSVSSQEEFEKLASVLAGEQFKTLGGTGTDIKFGNSLSTSPNSALSNMGNERIISLLKGNEDAIKIKNQEWQKYKLKNGAGSYSTFTTDFNNKFDPRIFQAQYMEPDERKKLASSMTKDERKLFYNQYDNAIKNGWIK